MKKDRRRDSLNESDMKDILSSVLRDLDAELGQMGSSLSEFPDLPSPPPVTDEETIARVLQEEIFCKSAQHATVCQLEPSANQGQTEVYEAVYQAVHAASGILSMTFKTV